MFVISCLIIVSFVRFVLVVLIMRIFCGCGLCDLDV